MRPAVRFQPMGSMPTSPFTVRTATPDRLRDFLQPLEPAFAEEYPPDEFEADRHLFEPDRIIGALESGSVVGCAGAYTARLTVPSGEVAAAAVTLVGVLPTHRRLGILRALMAHQLDDVRGRGEPVAILWASEGAIYQRFGYGLATYSASFELDARRSGSLSPVDAVGRIRYLSPDEASGSFPRSTSGRAGASPAGSRGWRRGGAGERSAIPHLGGASWGRSRSSSSRPVRVRAATPSTGRAQAGTTAVPMAA